MYDAALAPRRPGERGRRPESTWEGASLQSDASMFWFLCTLTGVSMASKSMLEPLVPLFGHALGASPAVIGGLVASAFLLPLLLAIPVGHLADQRDPRGLITVGAAGLALAPLLVALAPGLTMLLASQVVAGLAHLTVVVAAQALAGTYAGDRGREWAFGWFTTFASAGQFVGPLLAGRLVDASTFPVAFAAAGAGAAAVAAASRRLPGDGRPAAGRGAARALVRRRDLASVGTAGVAVAVLLSFSALFSLGAFTALFPVYLDRLAFSATSIGFFLSLRPLTALLLRPLLPRVVAWVGGRTRAVVLITLALTAGMTLIALGGTGAAFALAAIAVGAGSALSQPLSMAMTVEGVAEERVGLALGLRLTANRTAQFASPILFGLVAQLGGFGLAFGVSAVAAAALGGTVAAWRSRTA